MALTKIQKYSYRIFKNIAEKRASEKLSHSLESAHIEIRGAVYLSVAFLYMIIGIIVSYVVFHVDYPIVHTLSIDFKNIQLFK